MFGRVPQSILDDEGAHLMTTHQNSLELQNLHRVSENAYKQYLKSRPNPSPESFRRVKCTALSGMAVHPLLGQYDMKMTHGEYCISEECEHHLTKGLI